MANYTIEQYFQIIDDCYTPEFLMMEKAMERQRYIDIFTEMHNYISENIIELPFDAEVFTEEDDNVERKSVWDKNKKGWSGFWENVWAVIKNIWNNFWRFIRSIGSYNDTLKPQEAQKIADNAEAVAKDLEQKSEQEVQQAVQENPEPVKEAITKVVNCLEMFTKQGERLAKLNERIEKINKITAPLRKNHDKQQTIDKLNNEMKSVAKGLRTSDDYKNELQKIIDNPKSVDRAKMLTMLLGIKEAMENLNSTSTNISSARAMAKSSCLIAMASLDLYINIIQQQSGSSKLEPTAKAFFQNEDIMDKITDNVQISSELVKFYIKNKSNMTKFIAANLTIGKQTFNAGTATSKYEDIISTLTKSIFANYELIYQEAENVTKTTTPRKAGSAPKTVKIYKLPTKLTYDDTKGEVTGFDEKDTKIDSIEVSEELSKVEVGKSKIPFSQAINGIVLMSGAPMESLGLITGFKEREFAKLLNDAINAISKSTVAVKSKS